MIDVSQSESDPKATPARSVLLTTYAAALLVSAALLFLVQPMFTKLILPHFGGAPSVWSVAIVFFQASLLAGYAFAHLLTSYVPGPRSVVIHIAVMICVIFFLPLSIAPGWDRPPAVGEELWLIGLYTASIGLPFFALSANAPLLQAWFVRSGHPAAKDPYFLYAASNVGSFLALVSYPIIIEPFVRLHDQLLLWSVGFCVLIVMIAACGVWLWRSPDRVAPRLTENVPKPAALSWRDAARWTALAAVPSALLVAVTAHISTDVAAVPLLWVLPLALYLLTFVNVFARRPIIPHWWVVSVHPLFVVAGIVAIFLLFDIFILIAVHLVVFFICCLMCHGELARTRPASNYLTGFYLWMSVGGMVGGIFAGLIAPYAFNWIAEYPLLLALTLLCRPSFAWTIARRARFPFVGALAAVVFLLIIRTHAPIAFDENTFWLIGAMLVASFWFWRGPFAMLIAFVVMLNVISTQAGTISLRSFFGVSKIRESADGQMRLLQHGTTFHGAQRIRNTDGTPADGRPEMLLYYWDGSAIAQAFDAVQGRSGRSMRYAVIGLGAGALACRARTKDTVDFYEIDPVVVSIAQNAEFFSFLQKCGADVTITQGDARRTLADAPDGAYDLIVVDAYSSDAIPVHLLTREAMAIYLKKLSSRGIIVMHVTNRHLELASVVAGIATANGLITRVNDEDITIHKTANFKFSGTAAALARYDDDFGPLAKSAGWRVLTPDEDQWVWTDDYSNLAGSVLRKNAGSDFPAWIRAVLDSILAPRSSVPTR